MTFDNDTLSISNAEKEYGGKYACKATNPVGMDTAISTVTVNGMSIVLDTLHQLYTPYNIYSSFI